jgi:putative drug exporter of the RND superfamily
MQRLRNLAGSLAQLPGGRRAKFAVIAVWLVVLVAIGPLAGKFEDAQENDPADYLPANAESVKTLNQLDGFPSDDEADAITVFHRDGELTAADRTAIKQVRTASTGGCALRSTPSAATPWPRQPPPRSRPTAPPRC